MAHVKTVCGKNQCTGCMACVQICSKQAIVVKDELTCYNAYIDEKRCVNCQKCYTVCQQCDEVKGREPIEWCQGWATNPDIRASGSSGGIASAIAIAFVQNKGLVCSCKMIHGDFVFELVSSETELKGFSGSKYVKSNPADCYKKIKSAIQCGKDVLFIGLPCQAEALRKFIGIQVQDRLYTVDLICHGTPSPKVLEYAMREKKIALHTMNKLNFRSKTTFGLFDEAFKPLTNPKLRDWYMSSFLWGLSYSENCYSCKFATLKRGSDITLGDSWGTELKDEAGKGISLILCQTYKGKELLKMADVVLNNVDVDRAICYNKQLVQPTIKNKKRDLFFKLIRHGIAFSHAMGLCFPVIYIKQVIKKVLLLLRII